MYTTFIGSFSNKLQTKLVVNKKDKNKFNYIVCDFICSKYYPLSVVENKYFHNLLEEYYHLKTLYHKNNMDLTPKDILCGRQYIKALCFENVQDIFLEKKCA